MTEKFKAIPDMPINVRTTARFGFEVNSFGEVEGFGIEKFDS